MPNEVEPIEDQLEQVETQPNQIQLWRNRYNTTMMVSCLVAIPLCALAAFGLALYGFATGKDMWFGSIFFALMSCGCMHMIEDNLKQRKG